MMRRDAGVAGNFQIKVLATFCFALAPSPFAMPRRTVCAATGVDETGRHYMKQLTQGPDGRTYTTLEAFLLHQRAENLRFVLHSAFRVLYGSAVVAVQAFASDGDDTLIAVSE